MREGNDMKAPHFLLFLPLLVVFAGLIHGQEIASDMDVILETSRVTHAQASRFVLAAAEALPGDADDRTAFAIALGNKWFSRNTKPDTPIKLGELSFLIMRSFNLKGGLWYTLFPGPHYANRFLVYQKIIQGARDPHTAVSGERLLQILGRSLAYTGDVEALAVEAARHRLREETSQSLENDSRNQQGLSSGTDGILEYNNEFIPE
jgi:hypothetical protein